ncbi:phage tail tape measure protein [Streptomyces cylindrosporus]|uniref:Phage tail tape measure protein n=1 Tax=Streptomyces cylindrosporus TaxID=2927583 RepID=A0ABS9YKE8_9ACTN|nr:phage tail tape measure protein [Streptomyces cylindrosporus]MCI3277659.1 phage tail tape measure protein [Streptomyces cylindrosporus]
MSEGALLPPVLVRLIGDMTQLRGTFRQARAEASGLEGSFKRSGATIAAGMAKAGRSVSLIGVGVAAASTKMAADFESETMVLHTAAGESLKGLQTVRQGIKDIATGTGTDWRNLTDGMYQVEKAGYQGAEGITVLRAAAQGAREENAQLSTVTNAMTSVMASYHLHASDSVRVMNALKTAAGQGKMTMEEFSGSLSTVLPIASANKISLEQVTGALATLTQHGTSAREGTQELASTIRSLASPNNVAVQTMQRFGLSATDVQTKLGQRGLTGTLDLLSKTVLSRMGHSGTILLNTFNTSKQAAKDADIMIRSMPKSIQGLARSYDSGKLSLADWRKELKGLPPEQANLLSQYATLQNKSKGFNDALKRGGPAATTYTDAIRKMTGGAIGLNTTLQLTGESSDDFKERVRKVGESFHNGSKDVEGWKETSKLLNVQLAQTKQKAEVLAIEIGSKLIPVVSAVISFFAEHKTAATALAAVIGGVLALSVVAYAAKLTMSAAKGAVAFGKMGVSAVQMGGRVVQGFRSAQVAESAFSGRAGSFGGAMRKGFDAVVSGARTAGSATVGMGKRVAQGFRDARVAESAFSGRAGSFGGAMRKSFDAVVSGAKTAGGAVKSFALSIGRVSATAGKAAWSGLISGIKSVGLAMKTASLAALDFAKKMAISALSALRTAASYVAQKVALVASTIATKAAAAAQFLLDAAMDANPITLIILAIIALVGVLVLAYNKIGWFRAFVDGAFKAIGAIIGWCVDFVKAHWPLLLAILTGPIGIAVAFIVKYWKQISSGFVEAYHATVGAGKTLIGWIAGLPGKAKAAIVGLTVAILSVAIKAWADFRTATIQKALAAVAWVKGLPGRVRSALGNLGSLLLGAGKALIGGFIAGIKNMAGSAYSAAKGVVSKIAGLFPHSPAKEGPFSGRGWTLHSGRALMDGLADGIRAGAPRAHATMRGAAKATADAFARTLGIASPSKVFRQLGVYINTGLVDGLTGSMAKVKAATRRIESLLMQTYSKVADLKGTRGVSNSWVKSHEKTIKKLEAYAKKEDKVLRGLAAKRDSVAAKLKTAQKKLKDLQKAWSDEVKNVSQGIMQGFSIVTEAPQEGFALTAQDVVNKMRDQQQKAVQFAAQLQALKKKGLSADLIAQIAAAGVDQGGATATALAGATKDQIKQINAANTATKNAATSAGKSVADAMYGSGIKAAQGLVKGLQSQEKAIEKQMLKIAKKMATTIKNALKIKSPSQVFAQIGQWIPRGLAAGITRHAHHATTAVHRLAGSVAGAGSFAGTGLAVAGAGGTVIHQHFHFNIEGNAVTVDRLAKDVETAFLRRGMRNPSTYPAYKR